MEGSEIRQSINFQQELRNISTLQQRINQTKKELNHLFKIENHETKNIQGIYKESLLTTRNKLNFFQTHQLLEHHHQNVSQDIKSKQSMVKEIKAKEQKELRDAKELMKKTKEEERNLIRNNSLRYDQAIKLNKELEKQLKQKLVKQIKQEKENYKLNLIESRAKQTKLKEVKMLNQTLAKIERQPLLLKELDRLSKEKEEIENKVKEKRMLKLHMKEEVQKIKRMQKSQIALLLNQQQKQDMRKSKAYELNPIKIDINNPKKIKPEIIRHLVPQCD